MGSVGGAKTGAANSDKNATSTLDLEALEKEVEWGTCPDEISEPVVNLIATVHKLRSQVELLERVNKALSQRGEVSAGDTSLF